MYIYIYIYIQYIYTHTYVHMSTLDRDMEFYVVNENLHQYLAQPRPVLMSAREDGVDSPKMPGYGPPNWSCIVLTYPLYT